jgi:hypothetical protein
MEKENAECVQRLCKIYFDFFYSITPLFKRRIPTSFSQGCCWVAVGLLFFCCGQQENSNKAASQ